MNYFKNFFKKNFLVKKVYYFYIQIKRNIIRRSKISIISKNFYCGIIFGPYHLNYKSDGMITYSGNSYDQDLEFVNNLKKSISLDYDSQKLKFDKDFLFQRMASRMHIISYFSKHAQSLGKGDFVELGVMRGITIGFLAEHIKNKKIYGFDSFEGMNKSHKNKEERFYIYEDIFDEIKNKFKNYKNLFLIKGFLPEILNNFNFKDGISFLHVDLNNSIPEEESLKKLWPYIIPGGCIVHDDYAHPGYETQKIMFDNFAKQHNLKILSFPQGSGVIIKR
jgi:hypothetical protein